MILDNILATLGMNRIKSGVVAGKKYYGPADIAVTSFAPGGFQNTDTQTIETWSLMIKGKGVFGTLIEQETPVDAFTWQTVQIGDPWPIPKPQ